jgi:hypothetical protein
VVWMARGSLGFEDHHMTALIALVVTCLLRLWNIAALRDGVFRRIRKLPRWAQWIAPLTLSAVAAGCEGYLGGIRGEALLLHTLQAGGTAGAMAIGFWHSLKRLHTKSNDTAIVVGVALLLAGCSGTLEESRGAVKLRNVAGVSTARDQNLCDSLSSGQFWAVVVGAVCGAGSATGGGFLAWTDNPTPTERKALSYATGVSGLCAVGAAAATQWLATEWVRKECAL